jgi:hypothetical protein
MRAIPAAAVAAAACALIAVAPAAASSIAYTKDSNVHLTSPDGSIQRPVTTDGTSTNRYQAPDQVDDGTIVVSRPSVRFIYALRQDGTTRNAALLAPGNSCGSGPLDMDVTPDSPGLIVFQYIHSDYCFNPTPGNGPRSRVTFAFSDVPTAGSTFIKHDNWTAPRWTPGTDYASMVNINGGAIGIQGGGTVSPWLSSDPAVETIESFDISRTGNRVLVETVDPRVTNSPSRLIVWQNDGVPKSLNNTGSVVCVADNFATGGDADPRWSPDGTQIAWQGAAGIYVSPAPVSNNGVCVLNPRLIVPGGEDPAWGVADVPRPSGGDGGDGGGDGGNDGGNDGGDGGNDGGDTGNDGGDGGDTPSADVTAPRVTVTRIAGAKLRRALTGGLTVPVTLSEQAQVSGVLTLDRRVARRVGIARGTGGAPIAVARATANAPTGESQVTLRFTSKAAKKLRSRKKVTLMLQLTATDGAGNQGRSQPMAVTLKR